MHGLWDCVTICCPLTDLVASLRLLHSFFFVAVRASSCLYGAYTHSLYCSNNDVCKNQHSSFKTNPFRKHTQKRLSWKNWKPGGKCLKRLFAYGPHACNTLALRQDVLWLYAPSAWRCGFGVVVGGGGGWRALHGLITTAWFTKIIQAACGATAHNNSNATMVWADFVGWPDDDDHHNGASGRPADFDGGVRMTYCGVKRFNKKI